MAPVKDKKSSNVVLIDLNVDAADLESLLESARSLTAHLLFDSPSSEIAIYVFGATEGDNELLQPGDSSSYARVRKLQRLEGPGVPTLALLAQPAAEMQAELGDGVRGGAVDAAIVGAYVVVDRCKQLKWHKRVWLLTAHPFELEDEVDERDLKSAIANMQRTKVEFHVLHSSGASDFDADTMTKPQQRSKKILKKACQMTGGDYVCGTRANLPGRMLDGLAKSRCHVPGSKAKVQLRLWPGLELRTIWTPGASAQKLIPARQTRAAQGPCAGNDDDGKIERLREYVTDAGRHVEFSDVVEAYKYGGDVVHISDEFATQFKPDRNATAAKKKTADLLGFRAKPHDAECLGPICAVAPEEGDSRSAGAYRAFGAALALEGKAALVRWKACEVWCLCAVGPENNIFARQLAFKDDVRDFAFAPLPHAAKAPDLRAAAQKLVAATRIADGDVAALLHVRDAHAWRVRGAVARRAVDADDAAAPREDADVAPRAVLADSCWDDAWRAANAAAKVQAEATHARPRDMWHQSRSDEPREAPPEAPRPAAAAAVVTSLDPIGDFQRLIKAATDDAARDGVREAMERATLRCLEVAPEQNDDYCKKAALCVAQLRDDAAGDERLVARFDVFLAKVLAEGLARLKDDEDLKDDFLRYLDELKIPTTRGAHPATAEAETLKRKVDAADFD